MSLGIFWRVLEPSRGVPGTPCWLMLAQVGAMLAPGGLKLAYVGSCWGYVGSRRPQVGTKTAQDRFMLAQVGPKTPKMAPRARGQRPGGWGRSLIEFMYKIV